MKVMILAAGRGMRLRPLTDTTPKVLLPVGGRPLIHYPLSLLARHGFREVIVNLHYLGAEVEKALGKEKFGLKFLYSRETEILGTGGGIRQANRLFDNQPILVLNGDILIDLDLKEFVRFHQAKKGITTMVIRALPSGSPFTAIDVAADSRIVSIGKVGGHSMFTGVQILEPRFLSYLPEAGNCCVVQNGYQPALKAGEAIYGFSYKGFWNDIGTVERLKQTDQEIREGKVNFGNNLFEHPQVISQQRI